MWLVAPTAEGDWLPWRRVFWRVTQVKDHLQCFWVVGVCALLSLPVSPEHVENPQPMGKHAECGSGGLAKPERASAHESGI